MYMPVIVRRKPKIYSFVNSKTGYQTMLVIHMRPNRTYPIGSENMILIIHKYLIINSRKSLLRIALIHHT